MSSVPIDNTQSEASSVSTTPSNKGGFRGKRGKPSAKKHDEAFRTKVGNKVQAEFKAQIFKDTFGELDDTIKQLTDLCISNSPITVQLPITTRGIGLLVNAAYSTAKQYSKQTLPMSKNQFYRVTLAQLELQLIKSEMAKTGVSSVEKIGYQYPDSDFVNFEQTIVSHTTTLKPLAMVVNSVGVFTLEGVQYAPLIPTSSVYAGDSEAITLGSKRKRMFMPSKQPDPFVVTFTNLRSTVMALANPQTPLSVRKYFREHNPIPGALWTEDDRLQNPDDIMPNNYTIGSLRNELRLLDTVVARLNGKFTHFTGNLTFSGKGCASQLVAAYATFRLESVPCDDLTMITELIMVDEDYYGYRPIPTQLMCVGALSLFGEYPEYPAFQVGENQFDHRSPARGATVYSIRTQTQQVQRFPVEWDSLESALSVRH